MNNINKNINSGNYKITRLNIDSRHRHKEPKNIIKKFFTLNNDMIFTKNSSYLKIIMNINHKLLNDDLITINDIEPYKYTLRSGLVSFKKNTSNIYINHIDHNLYDKTYIKISGIDKTNIGNIPILILNKEYFITIIDKDNYYIDINIISNTDYIYKDSCVDIDIYTFYGVHIKYINASYPLTYDILQGYHTIIESNTNYIIIKLNVNANYDGIITYTKNYLIGLIDSNIIGYPNTDFFRYNLNRTFTNIKKIKLISTEIPCIKTLIKDRPANEKNNSFYFQILDDGNFVYKIDIESGKYDEQSLQIELNNKINKTKRNFGDYINKNLYYDFCISKIDININTNLFSIIILSRYISSNNINIINDTYDDKFIRINIIHEYHNLNVNDKITISGVINFKDIPDNIINNIHIIESISSLNNYIIKLPHYNIINNPNAYGGNAITITYQLQIKLLFNYNDTFGNIIGFNNIGNVSSFTDYNNIITNRTLYYNDPNINSIGTINNIISMLNFDNLPYILMVSDIFCSNINYKDSSCIFAKLFLSEQEGKIIYNYFVQLNENLYSTINNIDYLEFKFLTPDGNIYTFNNKEYSYTIEIYEDI